MFGDGFKYEDFASSPKVVSFNMPIYGWYDDNDDANTYNQYVGAEVELPNGGEMMNAKVRGCKCMTHGSVVGCANANPILNTRTYKVEFPDGQVAQMA